MAITATIPINSVPIGRSEQGGDVTINAEWGRFFRDLQARSGGVSGILTATGGGTGYSSYTVGDILYADTSGTLARLNGAVAGNALLAGAAPSWGKVGLTTHVDGVLDQGNGGTGFTAFSADLSDWLQEATSANLLAAMTDETGTGSLVFSVSPSLVTPLLGTPASGNLSNCLGYPASALAGTTLPAGIVTSSLTSVGTLATLTVTAAIVGSVTGASGSTTGNAATATLAAAATALATPRAINGVNFDGTGAITVPAAAGTLTGATLAAGLTASSLTSVGTLTALTVTGSVGVGAAPTYALHVTKSGGNGLLATTSSDATGVTCYMQSNGAVAGVVGTLSNHPLSFVTNNVERVSLSTSGQVSIQTAGKGLSVKEGSNAKQGTATLVLGVATVANTSVTANSRIFLNAQSLGTVTVPQALAVTARTAGTSFTITSSTLTDTSVIAFEIFEPS